MKSVINFSIVFFVLLTSCKKNDVDKNPVPGPNPTVQDTLLKKMKINSTVSADSSEFFYDNNGRLIKEDFRGNSFGSDERIVTTIVRNSSGVISSYTKTTYIGGTLTNTATSVLHYDPLTSHCTSKVTTNSPGPGVPTDSVFYTYAGNQLIAATQVARQSATDPYEDFSKIDYYYGGSSSTTPVGMTLWSYWSGTPSGKELRRSAGDNKINPLYDPAVGFFVGLNIHNVEDDNFDWNYAALFPDNIITTITFGSQYAHFVYTYSGNNRPQERVYEDLGRFVNRVTFTY